MMSEYNGKSGPALRSVLTTDHGVQIRSFNEDVWDALAEGFADEVFEEARAHSELGKPESTKAAWQPVRRVGGWLGTSDRWLPAPSVTGFTTYKMTLHQTQLRGPFGLAVAIFRGSASLFASG